MSTATTSPQPVIAPLTKEQAAAEIQPIFDKLTHALGRMPAFYGTMARVPEALQLFMPLYAAIIHHGKVEAKYKELAYLKTAQINGCQYCFQAHSASGKKSGVTDEQINSIIFFMRSSAFDEKEKAVLLFAERITRGASAIRPRVLEDLKQYFDDDQIVELTLTVCMANFTNRFNDTFSLTPDIG
jgi:uncharacterized peroxidase-related enzyme